MTIILMYLNSGQVMNTKKIAENTNNIKNLIVFYANLK